MFLHKYKRWIQFFFIVKILIAAFLQFELYHISVAGATLLFFSLSYFTYLKHVWKLFKICLFLELTFIEPQFAALIVYTLNKNVKQGWIIAIYYTVRLSVQYHRDFNIIDWVFVCIQFICVNLRLNRNGSKQTQLLVSSPRRDVPYASIFSTPITDKPESIELINYMPFGVCLLDIQYNLTTTNSKAQKYITNSQGGDQNLQSQLYMMIQKACLQQNPPRTKERQKSMFEAGDFSPEFQMKRLPSIGGSRNRAVSQQRQNIADIRVIINTYKNNYKNSSACNEVLKLKDNRSNKTYEFLIYDVTNGFLIIIQNTSTKESQLDFSERYRFQSMLINSFSHELRTPLNCSLQLLQTLETQIKPELAETYLMPSIISIRKLVHQINDILDFASLEAQNFRLRLSYFKISTAIDLLKEYFVAELVQKNIKLEINLCSDSTIKSDFDRVIQVLVNLMNNSIKFTKSGGRIQWNVNRVGSVYQFQIHDTGIGIPVEKLYLIQKILKNSTVDFFHRGSEELVQYVGLGLKVSSQIAHYLCDNGELLLTSNFGQYTTASFIVKNHKQSDDSHEVPTEIQIQEPYRLYVNHKCKCNPILLCDDIPFNHIALETVLKYFNIRVDNAYDGEMAIKMVKDKYKSCECGYKLIFMDIDMPIVDGIQATKEIVQYYKIKQNQDCVIVMCSAYDNKDNVDVAMKAGMQEILPKPVDTKQLRRLLNKYYF